MRRRKGRKRRNKAGKKRILRMRKTGKKGNHRKKVTTRKCHKGTKPRKKKKKQKTNRIKIQDGVDGRLRERGNQGGRRRERREGGSVGWGGVELATRVLIPTAALSQPRVIMKMDES